jgi:hypothetical protein
LIDSLLQRIGEIKLKGRTFTLKVNLPIFNKLPAVLPPIFLPLKSRYKHQHFLALLPLEKGVLIRRLIPILQNDEVAEGNAVAADL